MGPSFQRTRFYRSGRAVLSFAVAFPYLKRMAPTLGGRLLRAYVFLFFLGVAGLAALVGWAFPRQDRLAAGRQQRLVTTVAEITHTTVQKRESRRPRRTWWEVDVWYTFEAAGAPRLGMHATFSERELDFDREDDALSYAASRPKGSRTTVWYDAANPADSALEPSYKPVSFLVAPALVVGAIAFVFALGTAWRTVTEARASPLPVSELRRAFRIGAVAALVVAMTALALLVAHAAPLAYHRWRRASLVEGVVYLTGDIGVSYDPLAPVVRYFFRPDAAKPVFVNGDAWRFGRRDVASEDEARAIGERIGADYRANQLFVFFDPSEPAYNALSKECGTLLSARALLATAACFVLAALGARRLRLAASRLARDRGIPRDRHGACGRS